MKQQQNEGKRIPTGLIILAAIGLLILGFSIGTINCMTNIDAECKTLRQEESPLFKIEETNQYNQNMVIPENLTALEYLT